MANANASPVTADASTGSLASAPALKELPDLHYSVIAYSNIHCENSWLPMAFQVFVELEMALTAGEGVSSGTSERLNNFCEEVSRDSNYDPATVNRTKAEVASLGAQGLVVSRSKDGFWTVTAQKGFNSEKRFYAVISWTA